MDTRSNNNGQTTYIGIDQHKHYSQVVVKDWAGVTLDEQKLYHEDQDMMQEYFKRFTPGETKIAVEASGSYYWLHNLLEELNLSMELAHPLKVKMIAESAIKTDHIDAHALADLLRTNFLPTAYIPSKDTRALRERLRHRIILVHLRSSLKNRIEAVLTKWGIFKPPEFSNLYTTDGKEWLKELKLVEPYQSEINNYLLLIETFTKLIKDLDREIKYYVSVDKRAEYLMTIPGIAEYTAYLILAEIGDINRFSSPKKLTSYAGLVPSVNQSGKHIYFGRIKPGDTYLRTGLVESAHIAVRHDPYFKSRYQYLKSKKGSSKAITAIARELLEIVWWVLKEERPYYNREKQERRRELVGSAGRPEIRHGL